MKKVLLVVLACMMVMALAACNNAETGSGESASASEPSESASQAPAESATEAPSESASESVEAPAEGGKKVAGVVFFEDQFMKMLQSGFKDAAEAAGYEFYPGNTNNDAAKEVEMLNTYVTQGYAGVAIAPTAGEASMEPISKAAEGGLVVGVANANYDDLDWMTGCFTSDDYQLGKLTGEACAEFVKENLDGVANVGILQFRPANAEMSANRTNGFLEALEAGGVEVNVLADEDAWEQDKAITTATDMMTANPDINILWGANEGGTIGAAMAVKNAGRAGQVYAFGTDASEQTVALLQNEDDVLQALTGQDPYEIGLQTMQSVIDTIEGKDNADAGKKVIVPGFLLSRDNPDELEAFLDDLKTKAG